MDEPTTLPEGTILNLVVDDGGDDLDSSEREQLHAALREGHEQILRGEGVPAEEVLRELRAKRE